VCGAGLPAIGALTYRLRSYCLGMVDWTRHIADRYRLAECIGEGGMGRVWRARDEVLRRDVAVKEIIFPAEVSGDERRQAGARFLREARAAAGLSHPAVVTVHDVIEHDGRPWIVMELIPGRSLADLMQADGPLPPRRVARIGVDVLAALAAAHKVGVVHRDVKPSNVLIHGSRVVLTDFGAATIQSDPRLTSSGMLLGTPAYLAPERARGEAARAESDLWSLGATLYAAVEGHPPYDGDNPHAVLYALVTREPRSPVRAGPLAPVLIGLLHRDPSKRLSPQLAAYALGRVAGILPPLEQSAASAVDQPVASPELTHPATVPGDSRHSRDVLSGNPGHSQARDIMTRDTLAPRVLHGPAGPENIQYSSRRPELPKRRLTPAKRGRGDPIGFILGFVVLSLIFVAVPAMMIVFVNAPSHPWLWTAGPWITAAVYGIFVAGFVAARKTIRRRRPARAHNGR
jgi:serine/threonine protein kinase